MEDGFATFPITPYGGTGRLSTAAHERTFERPGLFRTEELTISCQDSSSFIFPLEKYHLTSLRELTIATANGAHWLFDVIEAPIVETIDVDGYHSHYTQDWLSLHVPKVNIASAFETMRNVTMSIYIDRIGGFFWIGSRTSHDLHT